MTSIVFFILFYSVLADFKQAIFLLFVAALPFAKGLTFEWIMIPRALVPQFALYDIGYYLIISPAYVFLIMALYTGLRTWQPQNNKIDALPVIAFLLFILCTVPALIRTPFPVIVGLSIIQLAFMGVVYLLPVLIGMTKNTVRNLQNILAAFTIFETGWILLQVVSRGPLGKYLEATLSLNLYGVRSGENNFLLRLSGTFFESSILGTFMLMHVFYFIELLIRRDYSGKTEKNIYLLSVIGAFISIIVTASRGIYMLFIVGVLLLCIIHRRELTGKAYSKNLIKLILLVFICGSVPFLPYLMSRLQTINTILLPGGSGDFRLTLNQYAARLAQVNFLGVGLNISPYVFALGFPGERVFDPSHPHNILFQILAEMGIPGLIAFLFFLWALFRKFPILRSSPATPYFIAALIFLFTSQLYPIFISQPEILSYFFLHAGVFAWIRNQQKYER